MYWARLTSLWYFSRIRFKRARRSILESLKRRSAFDILVIDPPPSVSQQTSHGVAAVRHSAAGYNPTGFWHSHVSSGSISITYWTGRQETRSMRNQCFTAAGPETAVFGG